MASVIKVIGSEFDLSTANTVGGNKGVRILETGTGNAKITQRDAANNILGTITVRQGTELTLVKAPTDTVESNAATTVAVAVAFTN